VAKEHRESGTHTCCLGERDLDDLSSQPSAAVPRIDDHAAEPHDRKTLAVDLDIDRHHSGRRDEPAGTVPQPDVSVLGPELYGDTYRIEWVLLVAFKVAAVHFGQWPELDDLHSSMQPNGISGPFAGRRVPHRRQALLRPDASANAASTIIQSVHELFEGDRAPRPGELKIQTARMGTRVELSLDGELDLMSAPQLEGELMAVESPEAREVLIDLEGVQFIDSTGLRVLLGATKRADATGHKLLVRHVRGQARRLFEIAGVLEQFSFEDE
jgi:anti-sigma B factor antagonist